MEKIEKGKCKNTTAAKKETGNNKERYRHVMGIKRVRISKWHFVEQDKNILLVDSSGVKISSTLIKVIKEKMEFCTIVSTIEKWLEDNPNQSMKQYDYIYVFADNSLWNSKGLFEWSRFIRKYIEISESDTEHIVKTMRELEREKCIYFKKAGDKYVWKLDKVV